MAMGEGARQHAGHADTMLDWLVELGVEELPVSLLQSAVTQLKTLVPDLLKNARLGHGLLWVGATPRRLAFGVQVERLQAAETDVLRGPPTQVAIDASGTLTPAGERFFKRHGISHRDFRIIETAKGSYLEVSHAKPVRSAHEVLSERLPALLGDIQFQKSMRWGEGSTSFARPVQWLVALLGDRVLDCAFAGIQAANVSRGHRFLFPDKFEFTSSSIENYKTIMASKRVMVDCGQRRETTLLAITEALTELGPHAVAWQVVDDDFLIEENTSLVEWPFVLVGEFDAKFLDLPEDVIVAVMRGHQRYFAVRQGVSGPLVPHYVAVVNTAEDRAAIIKGNNRVLRARLRDAQFFLEEDKKTTLQSRLKNLDKLVFQAKLGSVGDKVRRLDSLVDRLKQMRLPPHAWYQDTDNMTSSSFESALKKTIALCKCDLLTLMVGEFPELEGKMGRWYFEQECKAAHQWTEETQAIALAIEAHYQPRGAGQAPPVHRLPLTLSILDRVDTLVGCFAIGLIPTGSADPFALRRCILGILAGVRSQQLRVSIETLFSAAYRGYEDQGVQIDPWAQTHERLEAFVRARLRAGAVEDGVPVQIVDAVLDVWPCADVVDFDRRLQAVRRFADDRAAFEKIAGVLKRAANIAKDIGLEQDLDIPTLMQNAYDKQLLETFTRVEQAAQAAFQSGQYAEALLVLSDLAAPMEAFFENVLVMDNDMRLQNARRSLLRRIADIPKYLVRFERL